MRRELQAYLDGELSFDQLPAELSHSRVGHCGKAILYATYDVTVSDQFYDYAGGLNAARVWPAVGDLPRPGQRIRQGRPVATIFAEGGAALDVTRQLQSRMRELRALLI